MSVRPSTSAQTAAAFLASYRGPQRKSWTRRSVGESRLSPRARAALDRTAAARTLAGPPPLSDREVEQLVLAVGAGMGTFTDDDCLRAVRWAERVRIEAAVLDLVLAGELAVAIPVGDGELEFMWLSAGSCKP